MAIEAEHFERHAEETLQALFRSLSAAADDFDYDLDYESDVITLEFDNPRGRVVIKPHSATQQIWLLDEKKNYRFDWDVVENAFVAGPEGRTVKELVEEAIGRRVGDDVSL